MKLAKYKLVFKDQTNYGKDIIKVKIYQPVMEEEDKYYREILDVFINDNKILHLYTDIDDYSYGNEILERLQIRSVVNDMVNNYHNFEYEDDLDTIEEVDIDLDIPFNIDVMPDVLFDVEKELTEKEIYSNFITLRKFTNFKNSIFHMDGKKVKLYGIFILYDIVNDETLYVLYDENKNRISNLAFSRNTTKNPIEYIKPLRCYNPKICLQDTVELLNWHKTYMENKNKIINMCISDKLDSIFDYFGLDYYNKLDELRDERIRRCKQTDSFDDYIMYEICKDELDLEHPTVKDKMILGNGSNRIIYRIIDMHNKEEQIYGVPITFDKNPNSLLFDIHTLDKRLTPAMIVTLNGDVFVRCDKEIGEVLSNLTQDDTKLNSPFKCLRVVLDYNTTDEIIKEKAFYYNDLYVNINDVIDVGYISTLVSDMDNEVFQYALLNVNYMVEKTISLIKYISYKYNKL